MGHFFSKVSLFIDKKEAAAHLILDQDFATAPFLLNRLNYQMVIRLLGSIYILSVGLTSKASYHSAKFLG